MRKLGFEDTPDYDYLRNLMSNVLKKIGEQDDGVFDWMKVMEQQRIEREKERERERERERIRQQQAQAAQQQQAAMDAAAGGAGGAVPALDTRGLTPNAGAPSPGVARPSPAISGAPQAPPTPGPERSVIASLGPGPNGLQSQSASVQVLNGSMGGGAGGTDSGSFVPKGGDGASGAGRGGGSGSPVTKPLPDTPPASQSSPGGYPATPGAGPSPGMMSEDTRGTNLLGVSPASPTPPGDRTGASSVGPGAETTSSVRPGAGGSNITQGGVSSAYAVPTGGAGAGQQATKKSGGGFFASMCGCCGGSD